MKLPSTFSKNKNCINAVIETPKGCASKFGYDEETQMFKLNKLLPEGMSFPFHFGFIPYTKADDGDPLDVLVLLDEPAWPGCVIECKVLGVLEAAETLDGKTVRNDRIIAAAVASNRYEKIEKLSSVDEYLQKEIENFFNTYTNLEKKEFKILSKKDVAVAINLIKKQVTDGNN